MNVKNIPNVLTIFRITLVPLIIFFIFFNIGETIYSYTIVSMTLDFKVNFIIAGVLFLIASSTDAVDGYLARKNNWTTEFGKIWDPIADKILINSILISFAIKGYIPYFIPIIFIIRDTIVDAFRMKAIKNNIDISANLFGKLKTVFQIIAIIFIFFISNNQLINTEYFLSEKWEYYIIQNLFMFISIFLSISSGYIYVQKTFKKSR